MVLRNRKTLTIGGAPPTHDCTRELGTEPGASVARDGLDYGLEPLDALIMDPRDIAALIEQNLPGSKAHVQTDGQGHYEATVISDSFAGKRSLQRHQLVYGTLGSRVGREIHALAIQALTPDEWRARSPSG